METKTLSQQVYDQLRQQLQSGQLAPGTRLVNRTLAAALGTSTIPVREAIGRLVSEGLLELTPGAGAFVRLPDLNELGELYDLRESLEVFAAARVARFADHHLLAELAAICDQFRLIAAAIPEGRHATRAQFSRWVDAEERFHTRLIAASHNRWLLKVVQELRVIAQVFAAQRAAPQLLTSALAESTLQQHQTFLEILAGGDVEQAKTWMSAHIRAGRNTVLGHMAPYPASPTANLHRRVL